MDHKPEIDLWAPTLIQPNQMTTGFGNGPFRKKIGTNTRQSLGVASIAGFGHST
jgi:hypothetical protein